jgi:hypothetical protein
LSWSFAALQSLVILGGPAFFDAQEARAAASQLAATRALGTVKSVSGKTLTLTTDAGADVTVLVQDAARLLRIEPGQTDLKDAAPLQLQEIQPGDRLLVRGLLAADGKSLLATSVVAMKKMDIAQKQAHEREEWQKHGVGGLVSAVDPSSGAITIKTAALGVSKSVTVHVSSATVLRRYAPNSIKFDDAKPAPVDQIQVGDQLRARGTRSEDGSDIRADEVVSGSFRNIAGTVTAIDPATGTISVMDLATKKATTVTITSESQLRKLSAPVAQRIAARLKGASSEGPAGAAPPKPADQPTANGTSAGRGGAPGPGQPGAADLQQTIGRAPVVTLSDLNKGDAVMIVATVGAQERGITAITLLAGVEPILEASPTGQSILSPWSLSSPGAEAATP